MFVFFVKGKIHITKIPKWVKSYQWVDKKDHGGKGQMEKRIASAHRILKNSTKTQVNKYQKFGRECFGGSQEEYFWFDVWYRGAHRYLVTQNTIIQCTTYFN